MNNVPGCLSEGLMSFITFRSLNSCSSFFPPNTYSCQPEKKNVFYIIRHDNNKQSLKYLLTWLWRTKAVCPWRRAGGIPTYRGTFHFILAGETQCEILEDFLYNNSYIHLSVNLQHLTHKY